MRLLLFGLCLTFMVACCPAKKTCCQKTEKKIVVATSSFLV